MAGPAAELLRLELHHGLDRRSAGRTRFHRHWLQRRQARPDAALDWAFSIVMGFLGGLVRSLSAMRLKPLESLR